MKKISLLSAIAVALLPLFSCQKENGGTDAPVVFTLEASTPSAKTYMGEADEEGYRKILWDKGDRIAVNGVLSEPLEEGGGTNAVFEFKEALAPPYNAVYPGESLLEGGIIDVPRIQKFVPEGYDPAAAIMLGTGDAEHGIAFKNAMAYIRVTPKTGEEDVKIVGIELNSNSEKISGKFSPNYSGATLTPSGDDVNNRSEIFFDEPIELGTEAIFAIPAQEYTKSIDITVVEESLKSMKKSSDGFTAKAGSIYSPSFKYKADALAFPEALTLFGTGQPGGWDTGTKLEKKGDGVYAAEKVNLNNGVIKIYRLNANGEFLWSEPYYIDTEEKSASSGGIINLRPMPIEGWPGDPSISISNWGLDNSTYDVTINLNDNTLTLIESSEIVYPEKLYTCGSAFECGWNLGSMVLDQTETGVYTKTGVRFRRIDGQFKFWERTDWGGEYWYDGISDTSAHTTGIMPKGGDGDSPWHLSDFGFTNTTYYYNITVNLKTKIVSVSQGERVPWPDVIYIPGLASPGRWTHPSDNNKLPLTSPWVYSGSKYLNIYDGAGFKILPEDYWGIEYGGIYDPNTFDNGTMDIDLTNNWNGCDEVRLNNYGYSSGTYTITVDFNTMKLTISQ